jgi:hypothetical protein
MCIRSIGPAVDIAFHINMLRPSVWWLLRPVGIEEHSGNTGVIPGRPRRCNQISNSNHFNYLAWTTITTIAIRLDCEKVLSKRV